MLNFHRAMGGSVPFEEALAARLSLFKPSLSQLQNFLEQKPPRYDRRLADIVKRLEQILSFDEDCDLITYEYFLLIYPNSSNPVILAFDL